MDGMDELRSPSLPTSPAAPIIVFPSPSMLPVLQLLGTIRCPEKPRAAHLSAILAALPVPKASLAPAVTRAAWAVWQAGLTRSFTLPEDLPPLRLLLVGQSGRPQDARPGTGAVRAGRHAALHTRGRQLAQQGGVNRARAQAPRAGRTAPASP